MAKFIFLIALVSVVLVDCSKKLPCNVDSDCRLEECCSLRLGTGNERMCRTKGDEVGKLCGGDYLCPDCRDGLQCTNFSDNVLNQLSTADGSCLLPATGSCTRPVPEVPVIKSYSSATLLKMLNSTRGQQSCESDLDCTVKQCCAQRFDGSGKVCRDIGDDYGDSCGNYFCNSCRKGLICVPTPLPMSTSLAVVAPESTTALGELVAHITSFYTEKEAVEEVCLPANGTCRFPVPEPMPIEPIDGATVVSASDINLCHIGFKTPCLDDSHCRPTECCATHFNGKYKVCRSKGGFNKPCGGHYFCSTCKRDMECIPTVLPSDANNLSSCAPPATGTCKFSQATIDLFYATNLLSVV